MLCSVPKTVLMVVCFLVHRLKSYRKFLRALFHLNQYLVWVVVSPAITTGRKLSTEWQSQDEVQLFNLSSVVDFSFEMLTASGLQSYSPWTGSVSTSAKWEFLSVLHWNFPAGQHLSRLCHDTAISCVSAVPSLASFLRCSGMEGSCLGNSRGWVWMAETEGVNLWPCHCRHHKFAHPSCQFF